VGVEKESEQRATGASDFSIVIPAEGAGSAGEPGSMAPFVRT